MTTFPANIARVPDAMLMRSALMRLNRANVDIFRVQTQLATGRQVLNPSDDAVKAAAISLLDDRLEHAQQRLRNLDHASSALAVLDDALGEASELALEAKSIASSQSSLGASAEERANEANVIESLIETLYNVSNRKSIAGYAFGGASALRQPVEPFMGGYRYVGEGDGLYSDTGLGTSVPLTLGGNNPIGETSARHRGTVDLDPALTGDTRLSDLRGARGLGVTLGTIEFSFDGGASVEVDLSGASTVGDVADAIESAIRQYEDDSGETILGPGGVSLAGGSFSFDVVSGPAGQPQPTLAFDDVGEGVTARDLGLTDAGGMSFESTSPDAMDLNPRLTWRSSVASLEGVTGALGSIRVTNMGQSQVVDLSGAQTLEDVKNAIEGAGLGLRVEINDDATGIDVLNEVAGGKGQAMSILEATPSDAAASMLGIRTFSGATRLADFNDGRGVEIVTGGTDPFSGAPDPSRDVDFVVTLGDGTEIPVNLRPQDVITVQTVVDRINQEAASAGVGVPGQFEASVSATEGGIRLRQGGGVGGTLSVARAHNSPAPEQLGLLDATPSAGGAVLTGSDRAQVRVDNLFTHLIDLRDALDADDEFGIGVARDRLESSVDRVAQTRALVGGFAHRVESETRRQEDLNVLEEKTRSELRDLDYADAAVRFSLLQTQLQAAMQTISVSQSTTLLDFLG